MKIQKKKCQKYLNKKSAIDILNLPDHVLENIIKNLPSKSYANLRQTCTTMYNTCFIPSVYKNRKFKYYIFYEYFTNDPIIMEPYGELEISTYTFNNLFPCQMHYIL